MVGHFVFKNLHWKFNDIWLSYISSNFQNALIRSNPLANKKVVKQFSNPLNKESISPWTGNRRFRLSSQTQTNQPVG